MLKRSVISLLVTTTSLAQAQEADLLEILMGKGSQVLAAPQDSLMVTPQPNRQTRTEDRYFVPGIFRTTRPQPALAVAWRADVQQICQKDFQTNLKYLMRPLKDTPIARDRKISMPSFSIGLDAKFVTSKLEGGDEISYTSLFTRIPDYDAESQSRSAANVRQEVLNYLSSQPLRPNWKSADRRSLNCHELVQRHIFDRKIAFIGTGLVIATGYSEKSSKKLSGGAKLKYGPLEAGPEATVPLGGTVTIEGETIVGIIPSRLDANRHSIAYSDLQKNRVSKAPVDQDEPGFFERTAERLTRGIAANTPPF